MHLGEARRAIGPLFEHGPPPVHVALVVDAAHLAVRVRLRLRLRVRLRVRARVRVRDKGEVTLRAPYPARLAVLDVG